MTQKIKQIIIALVIIVVAFIGFKMFFTSEPSDVALVATQADTEQFVDGQLILALLRKLDSLILDDSVFTNKVFSSLVSFERPIEDQIPGRKNPFLPIGIEDSNLLIKKATTTTRTR